MATTPYDQDKPGGNSSFGNTHRPPDIQGDAPDKQVEPYDPAHPPAVLPGKTATDKPAQQGSEPPANQRQDG